MKTYSIGLEFYYPAVRNIIGMKLQKKICIIRIKMVLGKDDIWFQTFQELPIQAESRLKQDSP
jgi:hypothetical protein